MESIAKFMLDSLKQISEDIVKSVENQIPEPCYLCNEHIFSNPLRSFTVLICGHIYHRKCIDSHTKTNCPACEKDLSDDETIEKSYRRGENLSQSSKGDSIASSDASSLTPQMQDNNISIPNNTLREIPEENESIENIQDESITNVTSTTTSVSSLKRGSKQSTTPRKKTKKNEKCDTSMLIKELIAVGENDHASEILEERGDSDDFYNLYCKITKSEANKELANQEVVRSYYNFGRALISRLEEYKELHLEHEAQKRVNAEVRQQLPSNVSSDALRKTTQLARRIYDIFSRVGEDKISRMKTFSAWDILKLSCEETEHVICEILQQTAVPRD